MACSAMSLTATLPDSCVSGAGLNGAALRWRALEGLFGSAPINRFFDSTPFIPEKGPETGRAGTCQRLSIARSSIAGFTYKLLAASK